MTGQSSNDGELLGEVEHSGWSRSVELGDRMAIRFYPDGSARFLHRCDRSATGRGVVVCDPLLQMGNGHRVVQEEPLTIRASVLCDDCGTHGFVTDGRWEPV